MLRILLLEDNPLDVEMFEAYFECHNIPAKITVCSTCKELFKVLKSKKVFDFVQLDINVPDGNTVDEIDEIMSLARYPICVYSGLFRQSDLKELFSRGVMATIFKPLDTRGWEHIKKELNLTL